MPTIDAVIDAMSRFAANTKDDQLSVRVCRVAERLQDREGLRKRPLDRWETAVARPFIRAAKNAETTAA